MQTVDERILLHTSPNRATICWLSVSVISVIAALLCFGWYTMTIDERSARADAKAATAKAEVVTMKKEAGYLHKVAASNKERLKKLEGKVK